MPTAAEPAARALQCRRAPARAERRTRGRRTAYIDDTQRLSYGELDERVRRCRRRAARARPAARRARADGDARQHRLPGRVPRRALRRHRAGAGQHAADRRRLRLHARPQRRARAAGVAGRCGRRSQAAVAAGGARCRADRLRRRRRRRPARARFASAAAGRAAGRACRHPRRRLRLLALFVRLDRPAEGHGAHATPTSTGPPSCTASRSSACARATSASPPPSCSSPTASATR